MKQGELGDSLFVIVSGRIRVYLDGELPQDLALLTDGAFVGELALLTDSPRSASVVAEEPTQALEISRELVARVIAESPEVLRVLLRFFRDRMVDRFLRTSSLFSRFSASEGRTLVDRFRFLEVDPAVRLIREGESSPGLFLLLCGEATIRSRAGASAHLKSGDFFGELALLRPGPAAATVETVGKCWILSLPREDFEDIMVSHPLLLEYVAELAEERRQSKGARDLV
jgi:CRP-like cAMP-binding protein